MPESLMSPEDVAQYLDIPVATIYRWRTRKEGPPGFRVGKHVRYRAADVERWVEQQSAAARTA